MVGGGFGIGSYSDAIPIEVTAYRGITPDLVLAYDSSAGNSVLGVGWSLDGVSVIERASPGKGVPNYDDADIFVLNGQELVACAPDSVSPSCTSGGTHSTKVENYERVAYSGAGFASRWTITAKDGVRRVYAPVFALDGGADVFRWGLHEVIDTRGNVVTYNWGSDQLGCCWEHLDSVSYDGTTVEFRYEARTDHEIAAVGGGATRTVQGRIKTIDVTVDGSRLRAYKLGYTTSGATARSLLSSVQQFGTDAEFDDSGTVTGGTSLPAITIDYQTSAPAFAEGSHDQGVSSTAKGENTFAIDINGDGKTDMLELYPGLLTTQRRTWISNGSGFDETSNATGMTNNSKTRYLPMDVDADGKTDLVEVYPNLWTWGLRTWISNGSDFDAVSDDGAATSYSDNSHFIGMEINGDGKSDLLELRYSFSGYRRIAWISDGTGFTEASDDSGIDYHEDSQFYAMDVNGDGMTDLLELAPGFLLSWDRRIWLSHGTGFSLAAKDSIDNSGDDEFIPVDINGDGETDLLQLYPFAGVTYRRAWLSTGDSFILASDEPGAPFSSDNWYLAIDVNGDSKSDLIEVDHYAAGIYRRQIWLSDGTRFVGGVKDTDIGFFSETDMKAADVDGDGLSEMIELYPAGLVKGRRVWLLTGGAYPDLLTSITNSLGGTTSVSYTPSSAWENTNNPPLMQTATAVTATDGRGGSSTTYYEYAGGLFDRLEQRFLGYRHQAETLPCNAGESSCPIVETWFRQDYGAASKPERVDHRAGSGQLLRSELYEYTTNGATVPWTSRQTGEWEHTYVGTGVACPGAECKRKYTQRTFDEYGEVTVEVNHGDYDQMGDEDTTSTTFVTNEAAYIVNKPADVKTFDGVGTGGTLLTETVMYYDDATSWDQAPSAGQPTREARWLSSPSSFFETRKEYDAWGNLTASVNAVGSKAEFVFDPVHHLYPTSTTNALGQTTTMTWDPVCGAPTRTTDLNGQATTMTYDVLCRMTERIEPGGGFERHRWIDLGVAGSQHELIERPAADGTSDPQWSRLYFDGKRRARRKEAEGADGAVDGTSNRVNPSGAQNVLCEAQTRTNDDDGQPTAKSYDPQCRSSDSAHPDAQLGGPMKFGAVTTDPRGPRRDTDYQGRTWRMVAKGPDAATGDIHVDITYNARDQVASVTEPYYSVHGAAQPTYTTTIDYDALDRETRVMLPDGTYRTMRYGLWSTTATDALGHATTDHLDADGKRLAHEETVDGKVQTVRYIYDARDHLAEVIDPLGNTITYSTDSLGRMTEMVDPDWGTWTFEQDAANRITAQTDAKGQRTAFTYDALGRRISKTSLAGTDAAATVSWTYDEARDGHANIGRLTTMTDAAGEERFDHDAAGNIVKTDRTIDGERYTFEHGFDLGRRKLWTTYPDGDTLGTPTSPLEYDAAGRLRSIPGYVEAALYDAGGSLSQLENANGTVTNRQHSPQRGWLTALSTMSGGTTIQDLEYTRNVKGMITKITSSLADESWSYEYDELDRLIAATNASSSEYGQTLEYDAIGNITYNSQLGEYTYGAKRPHAAIAAGANTYAYDAAGLMISGAGRTLTWDGDNRLASIAGEEDDDSEPAGGSVAVAPRGLPPWMWLVLVPLVIPRGRCRGHMEPRMATRLGLALCPAGLAFAVLCPGACGGDATPAAEGGANEWDGAKLTFTYDANGARIQLVQGQVTRRYLEDGYEIVVGGPTIKYVTLAGMVVARREEGTKTWVHVDHLGSVQAETDASGAEIHRKKYFPYGEILSAEGELAYEVLGYTGQRHDDSGLVYLHARYYDPVLGRFISPDSIIDGPDTIGLNRYAYAHNDPVGKTDVDGRDADDNNKKNENEKKKDSWVKTLIEEGAEEAAGLSWDILKFSAEKVLPNARFTKFIPGGDLVVSGTMGLYTGIKTTQQDAQEAQRSGYPMSTGQKIGDVALVTSLKTVDELSFGLAKRLWDWGFSDR